MRGQLQFLLFSILILSLTGSVLAAPTTAETRAVGRLVKQPELQGKIIRSIAIEVLPLFEGKDLGAPYRTANAAKIRTRESFVRNELRFKEGEPYDEFTMRETERQMRALKFLREVVIEGTPHDNVVDIKVSVQDTWTLIPQLSFDSTQGSKNRAIGISESNLGGQGLRVEALERESNRRKSVETVIDNPRLFGSYARGQVGYFDRNDGNRFVFLVARPFLSFLDKSSWSFSGEDSSIIGRLFENGDADYIFRRDNQEAHLKYVVASGTPSKAVHRITFGIDSSKESFSQATLSDYDNLSLDPRVVGNQEDELPHNRTFRGPSFGYQRIEARFVSKNYIDRFDRIEDFNLGREVSFNVMVAPKIFGSSAQSYHFTGNRSFGHQFSPDSFIRTEIGGNTRVQNSVFENTLLRGEAKYYNVLGDLNIGSAFFGRHTLAIGTFLDAGFDLDRDRQFSLGADNGLRGYKALVFNGTSRAYLTVEDRIHLIDDIGKLISVGGATFFDVGGATNDNIGQLLSKRLYTDVGMGLRLGFPRSSSGTVIRIDIAVPLRRGPDDSPQYAPRLSISASQSFSSKLRSETLGAEKANVEVGFDR
jgi:hypothetical protein